VFFYEFKTSRRFYKDLSVNWFYNLSNSHSKNSNSVSTRLMHRHRPSALSIVLFRSSYFWRVFWSWRKVFWSSVICTINDNETDAVCPVHFGTLMLDGFSNPIYVLTKMLSVGMTTSSKWLLEDLYGQNLKNSMDKTFDVSFRSNPTLVQDIYLNVGAAFCLQYLRAVSLW